MKHAIVRGLLASLLLLAGSATARSLFVDGFDPYRIAPLFPVVDGEYQLPPGPTANRLQWLIGELAVGETTTAQEVLDNFDAAWLAQNSVAVTQQFIQSIRNSYPDGIITDLVSLTPIRATAVIDTPGGAPPHGWLSIGVRYTGSQRITLLGVSSWGGSVMYPEDTTLTMAQAADKFMTLSSAGALLVGRINPANQCVAIEQRGANQPRATASVFKSWVLGGVGRAIAHGSLSGDDLVPLVASELAPGGSINNEPLGTPFAVRDLATLMMGISDNTATDLLHEEIGRELIASVVTATATEAPHLLLPFLNISEQFHVFRSFPLPTALSYVNGSEAFQEQFLRDQIEPLGPNTGGPLLAQLLTQGTWQATPNDICRMFAWTRRLPRGSEAMAVVDAAFGSGAAQPNVRGNWDRVWYKGGSLLSATDNFHVLTHVWMLENAGEDPLVVIALSNSDTGGINQFQVQSVTGRMLQLLSQLP